MRPLGEAVVIRPLLEVWREEILAYLRRHRLPCRQDATNADPRFVRNRIRHELLPLLARDYNPRIKPLLTQLAGQCRTDADFLSAAAQRSWKRVAKVSNGRVTVRRRPFLGQPEALQRQLMRLAIRHLQGDLTGVEFRHWREIDRLFAERPPGTILDLPGQVRLERADDQIVMHRTVR
jgi:tRNA(Ile)-lysidine synthase